MPTVDLSGTQQRALELLRAARILPVVTVDSVDQACAIAAALCEGGLRAIELTLRTPCALEALARLKREFPDLIVGAGTVLDATQVAEANVAGADFIVTPGTTPDLLEALAASPVPSVPGAASASELMVLAARGFRVAKLFPAMAIGGLGMIKALQGPLPGLALCPTGGIGEADAADFLAQRNVACLGGSWMVAKAWVDAGDFASVQATAARARAIIDAAG